jgi:glycosyltransferase involved in cell wall biosynthesis
LVSIITVVFLSRHELSELLESVFRITDQRIELIVIDGGSNDGTIDLLREHDGEIDYWLSEADRGIYDAMNKGTAAAQGTFLFHLNSGDRLLHVPIQELEMARAQNVDVAAFRVSIDKKYDFRPSHGITLKFTNTLHHQGTFFRREIFPEYNIKYKIFADFDVNQRLARDGARMAIFDRVVALHLSGGVSSVPSASTDSEFFKVIAENHGWRWVLIAWFMCKWRGLKLRLVRFSGWHHTS